MKVVQYFSDEYLEQCRQMSPQEIVNFLEDFRSLHLDRSRSTKSKLISMKIPEDFLKSFRLKCELQGIAYQTKIKSLMMEWMDGAD
jgi:predicted DNA binding CopG/RHH family protein